MIKFDEAIYWVLDNEGGYTDDHQDKGGCTNYGLTLHDCLRYPRSGITTCEELKHMSIALAKEMYFSLYWDTRLSSILDKRVAIKMFDMMVNIGHFATVLFQRAANGCGAHIKTDGMLGPATISAINAVVPSIYLDELVQQQLAYYDRILDHDPTQVVFIKGWHNRARRLPPNGDQHQTISQGTSAQGSGNSTGQEDPIIQTESSTGGFSSTG